MPGKRLRLSPECGRSLSLVAVNDRVRTLLCMTKVEQFFPIFDSLTAAEQSPE